MKNSLIGKGVLILGALIGLSSVVNARTAQWVSQNIAQGGDITGQIECMDYLPLNTTSGGNEYTGMYIYIEGTSFIAMPDDEGNFKISYVQPGTYDLRVGYKTGKDIWYFGSIPDVTVEALEVVNVGIQELPCFFEYGALLEQNKEPGE